MRERKGDGPIKVLLADDHTIFRALEILLLVSRGMSNRQMASTLQIEEAAVATSPTPTRRWRSGPRGGH